MNAENCSNADPPNTSRLHALLSDERVDAKEIKRVRQKLAVIRHQRLQQEVTRLQLANTIAQLAATVHGLNVKLSSPTLTPEEEIVLSEDHHRVYTELQAKRKERELLENEWKWGAIELTHTDRQVISFAKEQKRLVQEAAQELGLEVESGEDGSYRLCISAKRIGGGYEFKFPEAAVLKRETVHQISARRHTGDGTHAKISSRGRRSTGQRAASANSHDDAQSKKFESNVKTGKLETELDRKFRLLRGQIAVHEARIRSMAEDPSEVAKKRLLRARQYGTQTVKLLLREQPVSRPKSAPSRRPTVKNVTPLPSYPTPLSTPNVSEILPIMDIPSIHSESKLDEIPEQCHEHDELVDDDYSLMLTRSIHLTTVAVDLSLMVDLFLIDQLTSHNNSADVNTIHNEIKKPPILTNEDDDRAAVSEKTVKDLNSLALQMVEKGQVDIARDLLARAALYTDGTNAHCLFPSNEMRLSLRALTSANIGSILQKNGENKKSIRYLRRAISIDRLLGKSSPSTLINLSAALTANSQFDQAIVHAKTAITALNDELLVILAHTSISDAIGGDADHLVEMNASALSKQRFLAASWFNLAIAQMRCKHPSEHSRAWASYRCALSIAECWLGDAHPTTTSIRKSGHLYGLQIPPSIV